MSRWVDHEYEGALSFLFLIIAAFLPWSISNAHAGDIRVIRFRWAIGELNYIPASAELTGWESLQLVLQRPHGGSPLIESAALDLVIFPAFVFWAIGSVLLGIALLLAIGLFFREEQISQRIPVRIVAGGLLCGMAIAYLTATVILHAYSIPGTYVPVGALFQFAFGAVLLTNRTGMPDQDLQNDETTSDGTDPHETPDPE